MPYKPFCYMSVRILNEGSVLESQPQLSSAKTHNVSSKHAACVTTVTTTRKIVKLKIIHQILESNKNGLALI